MSRDEPEFYRSVDYLGLIVKIGPDEFWNISSMGNEAYQYSAFRTRACEIAESKLELVSLHPFSVAKVMKIIEKQKARFASP